MFLFLKNVVWHYECISLAKALYSNKEHTVVKVGEESHSSVQRKRCVGDCGVGQLTIMAAERVRVRVRKSYLSFLNLIIYHRVSAYFVLSYMATPQRF